MIHQSCETLAGIGPVLSDKLKKCGIHTVADLLFHLPFRYQDRTHITPICDLRANEYCVIAGTVCKTEIIYGKKKMLFCYVEDKTSIIKLRFFHFNKQQIKALNESKMVRVFGEIRQFANSMEMIHPEYQILNEEGTCPVEENLTPIYPATAGLSQTRLRQLVKTALSTTAENLAQLEWMNEPLLQIHRFYPLADALYLIHNPPPDTALSTLEEGSHPAIQRLIFDELLGQRLSMQFAKQKRAHLKAPALPIASDLCNILLQQLPFQLTSAQKRVSEEIAADLTKDKPMLRLVQGDVGCGKTVVAALAAVQAIANGYQVAFMAPTELLSEQHAVNMEKWLSALGIRCARLTGKMRASARREVLQDLADQKCQLLIGTHALFQEKVVFAKLGLVIIDEQHRFGVEQRLELQQKGQAEQSIPHQLFMTATPIPRTLAMTQFAHLDISIINELPPGRTPVITAVINQDKRDSIIERLQEAIASGRQAYWVCTLIEESEKLQCIAATETMTRLQQQLPKVRVGIIHGRMKAAEKKATMSAFKRGDLDLLVATTVIEVGVDVPKASLMIIENAERLGLSQLHQLRGRVGRGNDQAHCLLLYQSPLSNFGAERLKVMRSTNDGFIIAEKDLQLRGGGEILGTKQTGYRQFKIANLQRDQAIIPLVAGIANDLVVKDPDCARRIATRWLGDFEQFLQG